ARSYGLHTDAAHRFERGVDFELPCRAMERATRLLLDICGGEPGPIVEAVGELPVPPAVPLRASRIRGLLGAAIPDADVEGILQRLGFAIVERSDLGWQVQAPSWRFDIAIEPDLIEELARIQGYGKLPASAPLW